MPVLGATSTAIGRFVDVNDENNCSNNNRKRIMYISFMSQTVSATLAASTQFIWDERKMYAHVHTEFESADVQLYYDLVARKTSACLKGNDLKAKRNLDLGI